jgi:hypothetical protein
MPDIKTALSAILPEWEEDQQRIDQEKHMPPKNTHQLFKPTSNVTRETYEFVRANPGLAQAVVAERLVERGFKEESVTSLCSQFVRQGMFARDPDTRGLMAAREYTPLKSGKHRKNLPALRPEKKETVSVMKRKYTKKQQPQGIAALTAPEVKEEAPRAPAAIILSRNWTAQGVVDKLSVMQARQLYDLLKQIFGG